MIWPPLPLPNAGARRQGSSMRQLVLGSSDFGIVLA